MRRNRPRAGRLIRRTLMRRDTEVAEFTFDCATRAVTGKTHVISPADLPLGCLDESGAFSRSRLADWIEMRSIPPTRQGVEPVLRRLGLMTPAELLDSGLALSLSDQYWLRPVGDDHGWSDVNFFDNDFPDALGAALMPRDPSSQDSLRRLADVSVAASSPDAALAGNLPKRWEIRDGVRVMVKAGKQANMLQEPVNEHAASVLCSRVMDAGDYVPYEVEWLSPALQASVCPCMVDATTELIAAIDVIRSHPRDNQLSLYERFVRICEAHGISDARRQVGKMLALDHIIANWDRHWGNFGVIVDSDSREWIRVAPIFDNGESFFCDQVAAGGLSTRRPRSAMPFSTHLDEQVERYAESLGWLDGASLLRFVSDELPGLLAECPYVAATPGRIEAVAGAVETRANEVVALAGSSRRA